MCDVNLYSLRQNKYGEDKRMEGHVNEKEKVQSICFMKPVWSYNHALSGGWRAIVIVTLLVMVAFMVHVEGPTEEHSHKYYESVIGQNLTFDEIVVGWSNWCRSNEDPDCHTEPPDTSVRDVKVEWDPSEDWTTITCDVGVCRLRGKPQDETVGYVVAMAQDPNVGVTEFQNVCPKEDRRLGWIHDGTRRTCANPQSTAWRHRFTPQAPGSLHTKTHIHGYMWVYWVSSSDHRIRACPAVQPPNDDNAKSRSNRPWFRRTTASANRFETEVIGD